MSIPDNSQFGLVMRLTVFREDGQGIEVKNIDGVGVDMTFSINRDRISQPNDSVFVLYNLSDEVIRQLRLGEFKRIRFEAGFSKMDNVANLFEGEIRSVTPRDFGSEKGTISTQVVAGEGETAYRFSTISKTWPAGTSPEQMFDDALLTMPGITRGDFSGIKDREPFDSANSAAGSTRAFLDDLAKTFNVRWSIQRSVMDVISNERASGAFQVVKKTLMTGLYDAELDEKGIYADMALEPAAEPNARMEIDFPERDGVSGFWRINRVNHKGGTCKTNLHGLFTEVSGVRLDGVRVIRPTERISLRD